MVQDLSVCGDVSSCWNQSLKQSFCGEGCSEVKGPLSTINGSWSFKHRVEMEPSLGSKCLLKPGKVHYGGAGELVFQGVSFPSEMWGRESSDTSLDVKERIGATDMTCSVPMKCVWPQPNKSWQLQQDTCWTLGWGSSHQGPAVQAGCPPTAGGDSTPDGLRVPEVGP